MSLLQPVRAPSSPARRIVGTVTVTFGGIGFAEIHDVLSCRHLTPSGAAKKVRRCGACSELFFGEADKNDSPTGRARSGR